MNVQFKFILFLFLLGLAVNSCSEKNVHAEDKQIQAWNKYQGLVAEADNQFLKENWKDAKKTYSESSRLFPNEDYPKDKLLECKFMIRIADGGSTQKLCTQMTSAADELFIEKRYYRAREIYNRVSNNCIVDSSYINHQLMRIQDSLHTN